MCPFLWAKHFCAVEIHRQSTQVCVDDVSGGVEEVKEGEGTPMNTSIHLRVHKYSSCV